MRAALVLTAALCTGAPAAIAQDSIIACQNQQAIEQVFASDGAIVPGDCRSVEISTIESDGAHLCRLDLSADDEGIVTQLREVAVDEQWWVRCDDLGAALP